jgi:hypothetical protein
LLSPYFPYIPHSEKSTGLTFNRVELANRCANLNGSQRAVTAAMLFDIGVAITPTFAELATILGVSLRYAQIARTLSAEQRETILRNRDATSLASLLRARLRERVPTDVEVRRLIELAGLDRVLIEAAIVAEGFIAGSQRRGCS